MYSRYQECEVLTLLAKALRQREIKTFSFFQKVLCSKRQTPHSVNRRYTNILYFHLYFNAAYATHNVYCVQNLYCTSVIVMVIVNSFPFSPFRRYHLKTIHGLAAEQGCLHACQACSPVICGFLCPKTMTWQELRIFLFRGCLGESENYFINFIPKKDRRNRKRLSRLFRSYDLPRSKLDRQFFRLRTLLNFVTNQGYGQIQTLYLAPYFSFESLQTSQLHHCQMTDLGSRAINCSISKIQTTCINTTMHDCMHAELQLYSFEFY